MIFATDASGCNGFLHVESWDVLRLRGPVSAKADQMLMVSYDVKPEARYTPENVWVWNSADTKKDIDGYKLLRPYHHVSIDLRPCAVRCEAKCEASSSANCLGVCVAPCVEPDRAETYKIGIYNVELWMANTLTYEVMATCVDADAPPCPRPTRGDMCTGVANGRCARATDFNGNAITDAVTGTCECENGFGDVGCDKTLTPLANGVAVVGTIPVGEWSYYTFEVPRPAVGCCHSRPTSRSPLFTRHV